MHPSMRKSLTRRAATAAAATGPHNDPGCSMRFRKSVATVTALATAAIAASTVTAPAQADQSTARASFRQIALDALANMERQDTSMIIADCADPLPSDHTTVTECNYTGDEAWVRAFQASLTAFRDGWHATSTQALLQRVYDARKGDSSDGWQPGEGYGKSRAWDAFGDGRDLDASGSIEADEKSTNPASTVYTVTLTDHVGEPLLEGYRAGAVPRRELQFIADAVWNQPVYHAGAVGGKCMAYSNSSFDQPLNLNNRSEYGDDGNSDTEYGPDTNDAGTGVQDYYWCVTNVSVGAAAFLQKLLDEGIVPTGADPVEVENLISALGTQAANTYQQGGAKPGFWTYAFRSLDQTYSDGSQDLNHNAYTAESAKVLGLSVGTSAVHRMQDSTDYSIRDKELSPSIEQAKKYGREVEGRMRAAGMDPTHAPHNLLAETQWYQGTSWWKLNTDHAQMGMWAKRLAGNASADSEKARQVEFMSTPKILVNNGYDGPASGATVASTIKQGTTYLVYTDARFYDAQNSLQFITNVDVRLLRGNNGNTPALQEVKKTGFDYRGAWFVWTPTAAVGTTVKFCAEVTQQQDVPFTSNCKTVTIQ